MNDNDKGYWFCLYTEGDDDYVEFTIKQLVKDELDRFENARKRSWNILTMKYW